MLTLGQGLGQKMANVRVELEDLTDKYVPPAVDVAHNGYEVYTNVNSLIHILHNMF